jgi:hypothetical protein
MKIDYDYGCLKDAIADTCMDAISKQLQPDLIEWGYPKSSFKVYKYVSRCGSFVCCSIKTPKGRQHYKFTIEETK